MELLEFVGNHNPELKDAIERFLEVPDLFR